jgi:hypothetical protein
MSDGIDHEVKWLRVDVRAKPLGVDREANVIRGVILAEEGPFKTRRGEFDQDGIRQIVKMANEAPNGLKSRFTHADMSGDALGKHIGRTKDVEFGMIQREIGGDVKELAVARGDLHLSKSAFNSPHGNLAGYVMDLTEEDPESLGMSLVIKPRPKYRMNTHGKPKTDERGEPLPPLWYPEELRAVDVVGEGDATNSMLAKSLSLDGLPNDVVRQAAELLKAQFGGKPRDFVAPRLTEWLHRVLDHYWPDEDDSRPTADDLRRRLELKIRRDAI